MRTEIRRRVDAVTPSSGKPKAIRRAHEMRLKRATQTGPARSAGQPNIEIVRNVDNVEHVIIRKSEKVAIVRLSLFNGSGQAAITELTEKGIAIIGAQAVRTLIEEVAQLEAIGHFRPCLIHTRPGWAASGAPVYVWPSGAITAPDGVDTGLVAFRPEPRLDSHKGTIEGWLSEVASPLAEQTLLVFLLSAAFAPYLMRFLSDDWNFALEVVGAAEVGKTLGIKVLVSTAGDPSSELVLTSAATTLAGLTDSVRWHSDRPLILNEMNSYGSGVPKTQIPDLVKDLGFLVSEGRPKAKDRTPATWRSRVLAVLSANDSIRSMTTGMSPAAVKATLDRIMPLPVDQRFGIFSSLKDGCLDADAFYGFVANAVEHQHGTAARVFMTRLVEQLALDEEGLRSTIREKVSDFARAVAPITKRSGGRVARSFGLIAIAGRLAKRFGALPQGFDCDAAAEACLRLHLAAVADPPTPREKLLAIIHSRKLIDRRDRKLSDISDRQMGRVAFLERPRGGGLQLSISAEALERFVGKPVTVLQDPELRGMLDREGKHLTKSRKVRLDRIDRLYCFDVPRRALRAPK